MGAKLHRMSVNLTCDQLQLGQAKQKTPAGWRLIEVEIDPERAAFRYALRPQEVAPSAAAGRALSPAQQFDRGLSRDAVELPPPMFAAVQMIDVDIPTPTAANCC
jgi:hypothetical protein